MRQAGFAGALVARADGVPAHRRDDWQGIAFDQQRAEAVVELDDFDVGQHLDLGHVGHLVLRAPPARPRSRRRPCGSPSCSGPSWPPTCGQRSCGRDAPGPGPLRRLPRRARGRAASRHLVELQEAPLAVAEPVQAQTADAHALQRDHRVPELREHAADLAVLALAQRHLQERAVLADLLELELHARRRPLRQPHATARLVEVLFGQSPANEHRVQLADAVARMRHLEREAAVVGDQDQPFAVHVEAPDREDATADRRQQIDDALLLLVARVRAHDTLRLVEQHVDRLFRLQPGAIEAHVVLLRIDAHAELGDELAIDLDTAAADQLVGVAATADAGLGEEVVEADLAVGDRRATIRGVAGRRDDDAGGAPLAAYRTRRRTARAGRLAGGLGRRSSCRSSSWRSSPPCGRTSARACGPRDVSPSACSRTADHQVDVAVGLDRHGIETQAGTTPVSPLSTTSGALDPPLAHRIRALAGEHGERQVSGIGRRVRTRDRVR